MFKYKNSNIERLRILASFGIICFHSHSGISGLIGYTGLPIFIMITICFGIIKQSPWENKSNQHFFREYFIKKFNRLIIPYIFWVLVYWFWGFLRVVTGHGKLIEFPVTVLLPFYGTSLHLWYIPFAFFTLAGVSLMKLHCTAKDLTLMTFVLFFLIFFGIIPFMFLPVNKLPVPLPQIFFAMPAVFVGVLISEMINFNVKLKYLFSLAAIILIGYFRMSINGDYSFLFLYTLAFLLVATCLSYPGKNDKFTSYLSTLTFGVYLIHPIAISIVKNMMNISEWKFQILIVPVFAFSISVIVVAVLKKTKLNVFV